MKAQLKERNKMKSLLSILILILCSCSTNVYIFQTEGNTTLDALRNTANEVLTPKGYINKSKDKLIHFTRNYSTWEQPEEFPKPGQFNPIMQRNVLIWKEGGSVNVSFLDKELAGPVVEYRSWRDYEHCKKEETFGNLLNNIEYLLSGEKFREKRINASDKYKFPFELFFENPQYRPVYIYD